MIRTVTKKLIAAALLAFSLLFSFITFGCSFFDFNNYSDVIFNIKTSRSAADSSSGSTFDFSDAFISVELRGEYSASKTQSLVPDTETQETQIIFSDIPVGKIIYVYAEIFKMIQNQNDESEKKIFYKGESEAKAIQEGGNQFTIKLLKQEQLIVEDETEENSEQETPEPQTQDPQTSQETPQQQTQDPQTQDPQGPQQQVPQTQDPQTSQETIEYIEIYISASGQRYDADTYNEGDEEHPFKYVDDAVSKIIAEGDSDSYWKILIDGETTGASRGTSGTNANYGHIELPVEITTSNAKSIIITGATPHENWLTGSVPSDLDTINRGTNISASQTLDSSSNNIYGSALVINTNVPVTITNLKITGGYSSNGGGIRIGEGARVSLGDGVLLTNNRSERGGAIYNLGTLFIYGTAVIGNKDYTVCPPNTNSAQTDSNGNPVAAPANYSNSTGGAIFNGVDISATSASSAKLYIGYISETTPQTYTGGIYYNCGSTGGAIYNAANSKVYMNSGTIARNTASSGGGGAIYNNANGYVELSGGDIYNNLVITTSSAYGGGINNAKASSVFVMAGGTINRNTALNQNTGQQTSLGGGVYNCGKFFMYGDSVIGVRNADRLPVYDTNNPENNYFGNKAQGGAGVYNYKATDYNGEFYMGYRPTDEYGTDCVEEELTGGIFCNYGHGPSSNSSYKKDGGGIYNNSLLKISSGTIAYNTTSGKGGGICYETSSNAIDMKNCCIENNSSSDVGNAIYITSGNSQKLNLGANTIIKTGDNYEHDIYLAGSSTMGKINIVGDRPGGSEGYIVITPETYSSTRQIITDEGTVVFDAECKAFSITPSPRSITNDGSETNQTIECWIMGDEGKPVKVFDLGIMTNPAYSASFSGSLPPSAPPVEVANLTYYVDDSPMGTYELADFFELSESDAGGTGTHVIKIVAETTESDEYVFFLDYTIDD